MNDHKYTGSCHCGNIALKIKLSDELNLYTSRTCDCNFCLKHGASYISDKNGELAISVAQKSRLSKYKQGDCLADFLICQICGVLVGACYKYRGRLYATVNSRTLALNTELKQYKMVSPQKLSNIEKNQRWQDVWFSNVSFGSSKFSP